MYFIISKELIDRKDLNIYEKMIMIIISRYIEDNIELNIEFLSNQLDISNEECSIYLENLKEKKVLEVFDNFNELNKLKSIIKDRCSDQMLNTLYEYANKDINYLEKAYKTIKMKYPTKAISELYNFLKINKNIENEISVSKNVEENKNFKGNSKKLKTVLFENFEEDLNIKNEFKNIDLSSEKNIFDDEKILKSTNRDVVFDEKIIEVDEEFINRLNKLLCDDFETEDFKKVESNYKNINSKKIEELKILKKEAYIENMIDELEEPLIDKKEISSIYNSSIDKLKSYKNKNKNDKEKYLNIEEQLKKINIKTDFEEKKLDYSNSFYENDVETNSKLRLKDILRQKNLELSSVSEKVIKNDDENHNIIIPTNTISTTSFNKAKTLYKNNFDKIDKKN